MDLMADFSIVPAGGHAAEITRLCDAMEAADAAGRYPQLTVERPWSVHNPMLEGEFAEPEAIRWYLERELGRLAANGARISVGPGREALDLHSPELLAAVDETRRDLRRKKLFLFTPERMALSIDRLRHSHGRPPLPRRAAAGQRQHPAAGLTTPVIAAAIIIAAVIAAVSGGGARARPGRGRPPRPAPRPRT